MNVMEHVQRTCMSVYAHDVSLPPYCTVLYCTTLLRGCTGSMKVSVLAMLVVLNAHLRHPSMMIIAGYEQDLGETLVAS